MISAENRNLDARRASSLRASRKLAVFIFIGGFIASLGGLMLRAPDSSGSAMAGTATTGTATAVPPAFTSLFGQEVRLDGEGLYRRDSVSFAAQERAQDLVTLIFALPLIAAGFLFARRGSFGGRLLFSGGLGYFLYCYGMMSIGTTYNEFFLLYVALFAAALYGFILSVYAIDADELALSCGERYPRRSAILNWLGRIVLPSLLTGRPPEGIDGGSTLFVQAFDLGILVPAAALSAFWLFRRDRRGYIAGSVLLVKGAAEGLAVAAMGFNMLRVGVAESLPLILCFLALAICALVIGTKAVLSAGFRTTQPG